MHRLLLFLKPLVRLNVRHPYAVLSVAILLGLMAAAFAVRLKIDTDIANLLPDDNPRVVALNELRDTVGGETEMDVAIGSPDFKANIRFAEALVEQSLKLQDRRSGAPFFTKVEFRRDTEILKDYALYLATEDELDELITYLDDRIEEAKLEANPFFIDFGFEDESDEQGDDRAANFERTYNDLIPGEYAINADSTVVTLKLYPTGSKSDLAFLRRMFATYDSLVTAMQPASFHPDMQVRFGGRLKKHLLEIDSIMNDVFSSFSTGIGSVLLLVMLYFVGKKYLNYLKGSEDQRKKGFFSFLIRAPVSILVIGIPLFLSLVYTFGITYAVLGGLNTMTSVLFVILFGLGIDYGIHFYARYLEKRSAGMDVETALISTYESSGAAIFTSAITTAVALFVLIFADFKGFSEFGFIATTGILLAWFAMTFILPAIVTLFERWGWILSNENQEPAEPVIVPYRYPFSMPITVFGFAVVILVVAFSGRLSFEYDFAKLEPEFPEYRAYQQFVGPSAAATTKRRNPAYILASNDEQVMEVLDAIRTIKSANEPTSTILDVEALQERFTTDAEEQESKFDRIATIRDQLDDPFLKGQADANLDILRRASLVNTPIDLDSLPDFLKSRFMTRDGQLGRFVMIYPAVGLSDGRNSIRFKNEIGVITTSDGQIFHSASTSIAAAEMLELMQAESPFFVSATFLMIVVLVLLSFKSARWSFIAMLPLLVGLAWTFGIMMVFNIKFNFYNLVVLPAILGIGNDNGVHLAARYLEEGPKSMWHVLKSTGQHISIGSLTTMLGFLGLLFTNHPGLQSIGLLAVIGVGMTLLSALTFLPALIQVLEDRGWIHFIARHKSAD